MGTETTTGWAIWCETCGVELASGTGPRPSAEAVLAADPHPAVKQHTEAVNRPGVVHRFAVRGRVTESRRK
jgi:hypothetical protein